MKKYYAVYIGLMLSVFGIGSSLLYSRIVLPEVFTVFLFILTLTAAGCQDMKSMIIADRWSAVILGIAMISCLTMPELPPGSRIAGLVCVSAPFLLIALLVPGSFGGGDIKLTAVCGLFLGWKAAIVSAMIGIFLGGVWTGCLLIAGKIGRKDSFPLGPFLCLGMALGIYVGNPLAEYFFTI